MKESKDRTFLQCTRCGKVYSVENKIDIESLYIESYCRRCGNGKALNLGDNANDIYIYYDNSLDKRYYIY